MIKSLLTQIALRVAGLGPSRVDLGLWEEEIRAIKADPVEREKAISELTSLVVHSNAMASISAAGGAWKDRDYFQQYSGLYEALLYAVER